MELSAIEVDVAPPEAERLARADPGLRHHLHERPEIRIHGRGASQDGPDLSGGEGLDLIGRLRPPEALSAPQRVLGQQLALDGMVEDDPERREHGLEGGVLQAAPQLGDEPGREAPDMNVIDLEGGGAAGRRKLQFQLHFFLLHRKPADGTRSANSWPAPQTVRLAVGHLLLQNGLHGFLSEDGFVWYAAAGGLLAVPHAAGAQSPIRPFRVGESLGGQGIAAVTDAFAARLAESGFVNGQNIRIEERHAVPTLEDMFTVAKELVDLPADVLGSWGTIVSTAAKKATHTIPVVFLSVSDPVTIGLVASLARPGGNMTGVTFDAASETSAKRLQTLKEAVPRISRVGVPHAQGDLTRMFDLIAEPNRATIAQRPHETRLSGLLAGVEGTTQWVTRKLARFASRSTPNSVSSSEARP